MLRLIGLFVTLSLGAGAFVLIDHTNWRKAAIEDGRAGLTFSDYLNDVRDRFATATDRPAEVPGMPTKLAEMLPVAPEGWTMRPAVPEDAAVFLPRDPGSLSRGQRLEVEGVLAAGYPDGPETVVLAYERGERLVVFRAVRFPDSDFTNGATEQRRDLQLAAAALDDKPVMTVRGLDLSERQLTTGMRARSLVGSVGAQIQLQILFSSRMEDDDLLPFLETLNVKAMNALVVDQQEGLGDLPVIVLASAMDEPMREAYVADRIASKKAMAEAARQAVEEASGDGKAPGEGATGAALPKVGFGSNCSGDDSGGKRCSVDDN